jgi:glycosyltransferase involved in cell wall biosynthesis
MKHKPLITIIINNYNYSHFLKAAIESSLDQTYSEVEVIVVDDGSTDNSREIISEYAGRVLAVLKENGGQASAFNAGFAQSQGEIVIFLDADDTLLAGTARRVSEVFQASPATAKVEYRLEVMDTAGKASGEIKPPLHLSLRSGDMRPYILKFPFDLTWMATSGNAFSAAVLREIFPVPEQEYGRVGADWYLSHLTPLYGPVVFLEYIGGYYRVHEANNYEATSLNLSQVRRTIRYMSLTNRFIKDFADRLELEGRPGNASQLLSVSYLTNRMISYKLERRCHPLKEDRLLRIFREGIKASLQRFDISWPMKLMFIGWFSLMVVAPRPLAFLLAEKLFFPEKRAGLNRIIKIWHIPSR